MWKGKAGDHDAGGTSKKLWTCHTPLALGSEAAPVASNDIPEGRAQNRRVELDAGRCGQLSRDRLWPDTFPPSPTGEERG